MSFGAPYPPTVVVAMLAKFFEYRGLKLAARADENDVAADAAANAAVLPDRDRIINDMGQFGYVRLDAIRTIPRGTRDRVIAIVIGNDSKYAQNGPVLRTLLSGIDNERVSKEKRLDELLIIAEEEFFGKKNIMDVVREFVKSIGAGRGLDEAGRTCFCNAYPYHIFSMEIPKHLSVPKHRLMSAAEVDDMLASQRKQLRDLPSIYANDPPVIWCGGREGQVVEIERNSEVATVAMYYRRIVARPL